MSRSGAEFFAEYGLRALTAAETVSGVGPLAYGVDGRFWAYAGGRWGDGEDDVHRRITMMLGERYRPHHKTAITGVLRSEVPAMHVKPTARHINLRNGMLRWDADTGPVLEPHAAEYMSTVQLPWEWDPAATCDDFDTFLQAAVAEDDRQRVWEILGYLLMSGNPLQRMFLLTGGGGNGKGVLLAVITALLGAANVSSVALHSFVDDRFAPADLFGKLANVCGDIDSSFIEKTGKIKELAGEDVIRAERKGEQPFQFDFWGKAIFSANGLPASADASVGWTRRWEVVNFPNAPARPDRALKARLTQPAVLRGILVRAVAALRMLMIRGTFQHGESAQRVHQDFAERSNSVLGWIDDAYIIDPSGWYPQTDLLQAFRLWHNRMSGGVGRPMGPHTFYDRLRNITWLREAKRSGVRGFAGLRARADIAFGAEIVVPAKTPPERPGGENAPTLNGL